MAAPDRAPRRTAAQMGIDIATGVPKPGSDSYQQARTSSGLSPGSVPQTKGGSSGPVSGSDTYMKQRNQGKTGIGPMNFPDTKASK